MNQSPQSKFPERYVPQRMCVVCREHFPKMVLTRYLCPETPISDSLVLDPSGKAQGRGFYVCRAQACQARFMKFRGWEKKCKGVRHVNAHAS